MTASGDAHADAIPHEPATGAGSAASDDPQQEEPPRSVEQTPVSGSTSSTLLAPASSPISMQTTDRTCSYPVSSRKVGARP